MLRYEIKNITPPQDVLAAMEKQMRAEREKRAVILTSEGVRDAAINNAEGEKQQVIKASEAQQAAADQRSRRPGAGHPDHRHCDRGRHPPRRRGDSGARRIAAVQLRVAEQYITQFGNLAKAGNTMIIPATLSDASSVVATAMSIIQNTSPKS